MHVLEVGVQCQEAEDQALAVSDGKFPAIVVWCSGTKVGLRLGELEDGVAELGNLDLSDAPG